MVLALEPSFFVNCHLRDDMLHSHDLARTLAGSLLDEGIDRYQCIGPRHTAVFLPLPPLPPQTNTKVQ